MGVKQEILAWDGKSVDDIRLVYDSHRQDSNFIAKVTSLIAERKNQKGASWLLKTYLSKGGSLREDEASRIYDMLTHLEDWETRLHILQSLPFIPIPNKHRDKVATFLRQCLNEENKFVRAWSYNGFWLLSRQYPQYRQEAQRLLALAMKEESAAVRARVRQILNPKKAFR